MNDGNDDRFGEIRRKKSSCVYRTKKYQGKKNDIEI